MRKVIMRDNTYGCLELKQGCKKDHGNLSLSDCEATCQAWWCDTQDGQCKTQLPTGGRR